MSPPPPVQVPHILVVDDDPKVRLLLRRCFEGEGWRVSEAGSGSEFAEAARGHLDLITLDLNLPDTDGLALAREVRTRSAVPIIMVTGKSDTIDRVVGLELGADDYIAKPFHVREVLARVRAVLRRSDKSAPQVNSAQPEPQGTLSFDRWVLDVPKRELRTRTGEIVPLTTAEFGLLEVLARSPKIVLSRDTIMDKLKGHEWSPLDRTIDNIVAKLRKKIEVDPELPLLIKTVRGVGYSFTADVKAG